MDVNELLQKLAEYVPRIQPAIQASAYLHFAKGLPIWSSRAATYFAFCRTIDVASTFLPSLDLPGLSINYDQAIQARSSALLESAHQAYKDSMLKYQKQTALQSDVLVELECLMDGIASEQPAVFKDDDDFERSRHSCELGIIGLAQSFLGLQDQEFVPEIGYIDGVWVLLAVSQTAQWRTLEVLSQEIEWSDQLKIAKSITQSARCKYAGYLDSLANKIA